MLSVTQEYLQASTQYTVVQDVMWTNYVCVTLPMWSEISLSAAKGGVIICVMASLNDISR